MRFLSTVAVLAVAVLGFEQSLIKSIIRRPLTNLLSTNTEYDAQSITVLEGLEPVRKRPGMYIGSTGPKGLHHLVFEVVDNSVDESLAGHCTEITVTLNNDGSVEVCDNGRGIPCGVHPTTGKSTLETVLCVLHAGGKFGGEDSGYKVSGGLHGVGISVVNALSEKLTVEVIRDNQFHTMSFSEGIPLSGIQIKPLDSITRSSSSDTSNNRGTKVIFKPDPKIFKTTLDFEFDKLESRLDELAYLNAGLTIKLIDKRSKAARRQFAVNSILNDDLDEPQATHSVSKETSKTGSGKGKTKGTSLLAANKEVKPVISLSPEDTLGEDLPPRIETYHHKGGLIEMVQHLCEDKTNLHPEVDIISLNEERKGIAVSVAMRWSADSYTDSLTGFANNIRTSDGGSHLDGLKSAVTRTINTLARKVRVIDTFCYLLFYI